MKGTQMIKFENYQKYEIFLQSSLIKFHRFQGNDWQMEIQKSFKCFKILLHYFIFNSNNQYNFVSYEYDVMLKVNKLINNCN